MILLNGLNLFRRKLILSGVVSKHTNCLCFLGKGEKTMKRQRHLALSLAAVMAAISSTALAQSNNGGAINRGADRLVAEPTKPLVNRLAPPDASQARAQTAETVKAYTPGVSQGSDAAPPLIGTRAFGTFGIPYTSTRVQLGSSSYSSTVGANFLSTTSPYRQIGKLLINGGWCSATLIRRSVVVTAAHCIQNFGSGSNIFGGYTFIPGHYGAAGAILTQREPYGRWT